MPFVYVYYAVCIAVCASACCTCMYAAYMHTHSISYMYTRTSYRIHTHVQLQHSGHFLTEKKGGDEFVRRKRCGDAPPVRAGGHAPSRCGVLRAGERYRRRFVAQQLAAAAAGARAPRGRGISGRDVHGRGRRAEVDPGCGRGGAARRARVHGAAPFAQGAPCLFAVCAESVLGPCAVT